MPGHDSVVDVEPGAPVTNLSTWTREVWRRKFLVVLVVLWTLAAAVGAWMLDAETYRASAAVKVSNGGISEGPQSAAQIGTLLATQVEVLQSTQLANEVAQKLDDSVDIVSTQVEGVPESQVAIVTVEATTAAGAAEAANEFILTYQARRDRGVVEEATSRSEILQAQIDEVAALLEEAQTALNEESQRVNLEQARITIARDNAALAGVVLGPEDVVLPDTSTLNALQARYTELAGQLSTLRTEQQGYETAAAAGNGGVAIVSVAQEPSAPANTGLPQTLALAGVLGLGLGVGLALLLGARDRRLHDVAAVRRAYPACNVLATVDKHQSGARAATRVGDVLLPAAQSAPVDAYLEVVLALAAQWPEPMRTLLVCSPSQEEEELASAGSLAVAFARLGKHVVLVDVARPGGSSKPAATGPDRAVTTTDGRSTLEEALVPVDVPGDGTLHVLPSGRTDEGWALDQGNMRRVLRSLAGDDGVVVVHGPPLGSGAGAVALAPEVDGVLVPVLLGRSRGPDLASASARLVAVGGRLLGVVVHRQKVHGDAASIVPVEGGAVSRDGGQPGGPATDRSVSSSSRS